METKCALRQNLWNSQFQTLISIILSARTKDETTIRVGKILFKE